MRKILVGAIALVLAVYAAGVGSLAWAMRQTPERFGRFMKHMPTIGFIALPFETLWMGARAGTLRVGDQAPDFRLATVDKTAQVQLSSFRGKKPVVLIFGSYT